MLQLLCDPAKGPPEYWPPIDCAGWIGPRLLLGMRRVGIDIDRLRWGEAGGADKRKGESREDLLGGGPLVKRERSWMEVGWGGDPGCSRGSFVTQGIKSAVEEGSEVGWCGNGMRWTASKHISTLPIVSSSLGEPLIPWDSPYLCQHPRNDWYGSFYVMKLISNSFQMWGRDYWAQGTG